MIRDSKLDKAIPDDFLEKLFSISPVKREDIKKELSHVCDILERADNTFPQEALMGKVMQMVFKHLPKTFENKQDELRFNTLQEAAIKIAQHIDQTNVINRPSFHNRTHFILVELCGRVIDNAGALNTIVHLSCADRACMAVTDLLHDLDHDGSNNVENGIYHPMRLENKALEQAMPFLKDARVTEEDISRITSSVRATDPNLPKEIMHKAYKFHFKNDSVVSFTDWQRRISSFDKETQLQLNELAENLFYDQKASFMAARMGDADLFASFGLNKHRADCETRKLNHEFQLNGLTALCDTRDKPLPQGRLFGLLKMLSGHSSNNGEFEVNFTTPGAEFLGGDCARDFQTNAEKLLGEKQTAQLYQIVGLVYPKAG